MNGDAKSEPSSSPMAREQVDPPSAKGAAVASTMLGVLAGGLLVLAVGVGLLLFGLSAMATDQCGSTNTCNNTASTVAGVLSAGAPMVVLIASAILASVNSARKITGAGSPVAVLWWGVLVDLICFLGAIAAADAVPNR